MTAHRKVLGNLAVVLCLAAVAAVPMRSSLAVERKRPEPPRRAEALSNPRRDRLLKPDEVVAALRLEPGHSVADIGSGPGYFSLPLARAVGPSGRVYGVDIEPHFLSELERRARLSGLSNVVPILTSPDSPGLPPASVDLVFFCSAYRHIGDRRAYLGKLRRSLRPGGRIAVLEWRKTDLSGGELRPLEMPSPPHAERIDPKQVARELREAGFTILEQPEFLEHHFFLVAGRGD